MSELNKLISDITYDTGPSNIYDYDLDKIKDELKEIRDAEQEHIFEPYEWSKLVSWLLAGI